MSRRSRLALALALLTIASVPPAMAAAPAPSGTMMPTGTFTLANIGRVTTSNGAPGAGYTTAPVPNGSLSAPLPANANSKSPEFSPSLFRPKSTYRGEGYIAGSSAQEQQQRKVGPAPGIKLKVPLD